MYQRGCMDSGVSWGVLTAATAVAVLDAGALAFKSTPKEAVRPGRRRSATLDFDWAPVVAVGERGARLGVVAAF